MREKVARKNAALLHSAAGQGNSDKLKKLLDLGVDPNVRKEDGEGRRWTPLHTVIHAHGHGEREEDNFEYPCEHEGRTACVRLLLEAGASPNALGEPEPAEPEATYVPLHAAVLRGLLDVSKELIKAGADVNARPYGVAAIDGAAYYGHVDCVALLLSKGALVNRSCQHEDVRWTTLGFALQYTAVALFPRQLRVIARLLRAGAEIPLATEQMAALAEGDPRRDYLQRVSAAGGFPAYEKQHREKLVAMLAPKLGHLLPSELVSVVITFWAPVGLH